MAQVQSKLDTLDLLIRYLKNLDEFIHYDYYPIHTLKQTLPDLSRRDPAQPVAIY